MLYKSLYKSAPIWQSGMHKNLSLTLPPTPTCPFFQPEPTTSWVITPPLVHSVDQADLKDSLWWWISKLPPLWVLQIYLSFPHPLLNSCLIFSPAKSLMILESGNLLQPVASSLYLFLVPITFSRTTLFTPSPLPLMIGSSVKDSRGYRAGW